MAGVSNTAVAALAQALMQSSPQAMGGGIIPGAGMMQASPDAQAIPVAMQYEYHPSKDAAQSRLNDILAMGRYGYISPMGSDGSYELRHWSD